MNIDDLMKQGLQSLDEVKVGDYVLMHNNHFSVTPGCVIDANDTQITVERRSHYLHETKDTYWRANGNAISAQCFKSFVSIPTLDLICRYQQETMNDVKRGIDELLEELETITESLTSYQKRLGGEL